MVGGDEQVFERCLPLFRAMGRHIVHVGPHGAGQTVKLCNQVIVALHLLAMGEGLAFAAKAGVDLEKMLSVVQKGAAGSWALDNLAPRVLRGDYRARVYGEAPAKGSAPGAGSCSGAGPAAGRARASCSNYCAAYKRTAATKTARKPS